MSWMVDMKKVSIHAVRSMGGSQTLQKLSAIFNINWDDWLEIDFSRWGSKEDDNEKFELLKSAVLHRKSVKIRYAGSWGTISERIIQPHKLAYKGKAWYLKAFCMEKLSPVYLREAIAEQARLIYERNKP